MAATALVFSVTVAARMGDDGSWMATCIDIEYSFTYRYMCVHILTIYTCRQEYRGIYIFRDAYMYLRMMYDVYLPYFDA